MLTSLLEKPIISQILIIFAALFCGSGVWLVVQITATEEVTLNIDVIPINVPPEAELFRSPEQVPVKFSFPATESARMKPDNFAVEVDFSDLKLRLGTEFEGSGERVLSRDMISNRDRSIGSNVTPIDILLPQISWTARLRNAPAVVRPVVVGRPAPGYVYDPDRAIVDGSDEFSVLLTEEAEEEFLASGADYIAVTTQPLDVTGKFGVIRQQVNLVLPAGVSLPPYETVRNRIVVLEITEETTTRRIESVPVIYNFLTEVEGLVATIEPREVDVLVTGRISAVNNITPDMIEFGLFGIAERAGESKAVKIEARIADPFFRTIIEDVATEPDTVTVTIDSAD